MFRNIVIGKPIVPLWELFATDEKDWEENEKNQTLFTENTFLPQILKDAGVVKSTSEVRKNKPQFVKNLDALDFIEVKWGKNKIFIAIGERNIED